MVKKTLLIVLTALAIVSIVSRSALADDCSFVSPPSLIDEPNISSTVSLSVTLEWSPGGSATSNILLLHMDEALWNGTPGEVIDSSPAGSNNGTAYNADTIAGGESGRAGSFNGTDSYVDLTKASLNGISNWTFSAWIYPLNSSTSLIYSEGNPGVTFYIAAWADGSVHVATWHVSRSGYWMTYATPAGVILPNTWNSISVALSNGYVNTGNVTVYVNENSYSGTLGIAYYPSISYATIGRSVGSTHGGTQPTYPFYGYIDEVSIYGPGGGDPVEYYVQVDDLSDFSSPYESGWLTEGAANCDGSKCSWTLTLATNKEWYWRVRARDVNYVDIISPWSFDYFAIYKPPSATTVIPAPDTTNWSINLWWNAVTCPDGDPVRYSIQMDDDPNFGSPDFTSEWSADTYKQVTYHDLPIAGVYCWRVRVRDNAHTVLMSPWSASDCFDFQHGH